jgi:hypothetical protein
MSPLQDVDQHPLHAARLPGGHPLHRLLAWEHAAIVELFEAWGEIDRSHGKLAHRRSRIGKVHVSESTVRVHGAPRPGRQGVVLEGPPPREPAPRAPWPDWLEWKPNRVWAYDVTRVISVRHLRGNERHDTLHHIIVIGTAIEVHRDRYLVDHL